MSKTAISPPKKRFLGSSTPRIVPSGQPRLLLVGYMQRQRHHFQEGTNTRKSTLSFNLFFDSPEFRGFLHIDDHFEAKCFEHRWYTKSTNEKMPNRPVRFGLSQCNSSVDWSWSRGKSCHRKRRASCPCPTDRFGCWNILNLQVYNSY